MRDISYAGALVLTDKKIGIGDQVLLRLTEKDGGVMDFEGTVANCSKDPITHQFRVGVALSEPEADRREKVSCCSCGIGTDQWPRRIKCPTHGVGHL